MKKIHISYFDEETGAGDRIEREIPIVDEYNFCKGILVDLYLLMDRNSLVRDWMREQFKEMKLLEP